MTVSGVNPSSSASGAQYVDGVTVKKGLEEAQKTVLDAQAQVQKATEDEYQEFVEGDETSAEKGTAKDSNSVKEKDDRVLRYYEQLETLRQQLDDIGSQRRALIAQMQAGTSASDIQSQFSALNNQARSINNSINLVFSNIIQLEDTIESERLAATLSSTGADSTSAAALTTGVAAVNSLSGQLSSNAKVDTQMGRKLAEAVVSSINTNGSTTGWCLRGVNRAMSKIYGYGFAFGSAYQALGALQNDSNFVEITSQYPTPADLKKLPAGAIVVWGKNGAHPHGHISIALGDGREASDHIANQYTNCGNGYHIFMPKEK